VFLPYWKYVRRTGVQGPGEHGIRVANRQDHSYGAATDRFGVDIFICRGLFTQPKLCAVNRESHDYASSGDCKAIGFSSPER
jgi:hypothetical protein